MAKKRVTVAQYQKILNELCDLTGSGQFEPCCSDAEEFIGKVKKMLNKPTNYDFISYRINVPDVNLPGGIDKEDVEIQLVIDGKVIGVADWIELEDYAKS